MASMMQWGGSSEVIDGDRLKGICAEIIAQVVDGGVKRLLLLPPDHTRLYSGAGEITKILFAELRDRVHIDIMPALGTHVPMDEAELSLMFGDDIPRDRFLPHHWRDDLKVFGEVPAEYVKEVSEGRVDYSMQVAVNKALVDGGYDLILSIGQVVPHEVIGMANYTKNILIGVGGGQSIHRSHYLGAAYGMERIMGRIDTPVRKVLNKGFDDHLSELPLHFMLTVMEKVGDDVLMRGVTFGQSHEVFETAAKWSQEANLDLLDAPIKKAVVYLDPREFKTTWLGNKAVYRLRMAMADDGELIILAPALQGFGEDGAIDALIRKYGYVGTEAVLKAVDENEDLQNNLSAAAHLIHGSSDGRFNITYCAGPGVTKEEVEGVGFAYKPYEEMAKVYDPDALQDGFQTVEGEDIFYVSNPALGLWALKEQFAD